MKLETCASGTAVGLGMGACVVGCGAAAAATGGAVLAKAGYAGYSAGAMAKTAAIGTSMTTAPVTCCLSSIRTCYSLHTEGKCPSDSDIKDTGSALPIAAIAGSALMPNVGIEKAATAAVVGGGVIGAGILGLACAGGTTVLACSEEARSSVGSSLDNVVSMVMER